MQLTQNAIRTLLTELIDGPSGLGCWVINRDEPGLCDLLSTMSAVQALRAPAPGRKSIAEHAHHLTYALSLNNRWAGGEGNPFATADWERSWRVETLDNEAWSALINQLREQARAWADAVIQPREWDEITLTGAIASAAHAAYHFGAIKQIALTIVITDGDAPHASSV